MRKTGSAVVSISGRIVGTKLDLSILRFSGRRHPHGQGGGTVLGLLCVSVAFGIGVAAAASYVPIPTFLLLLAAGIAVAILASSAKHAKKQLEQECRAFDSPPHELIHRHGKLYRLWFDAHTLACAEIAWSCGFGLLNLFGPSVGAMTVMAAFLSCTFFALLADTLRARPLTLALCWRFPLPPVSRHWREWLTYAGIVMVPKLRRDYAQDCDWKAGGSVNLGILEVLERARSGQNSRYFPLWEKSLEQPVAERVSRACVLAGVFACALLVAIPVVRFVWGTDQLSPLDEIFHGWIGGGASPGNGRDGGPKAGSQQRDPGGQQSGPKSGTGSDSDNRSPQAQGGSEGTPGAGQPSGEANSERGSNTGSPGSGSQTGSGSTNPQGQQGSGGTPGPTVGGATAQPGESAGSRGPHSSAGNGNHQATGTPAANLGTDRPNGTGAQQGRSRQAQPGAIGNPGAGQPNGADSQQSETRPGQPGAKGNPSAGQPNGVGSQQSETRPGQPGANGNPGAGQPDGAGSQQSGTQPGQPGGNGNPAGAQPNGKGSQQKGTGQGQTTSGGNPGSGQSGGGIGAQPSGASTDGTGSSGGTQSGQGGSKSPGGSAGDGGAGSTSSSSGPTADTNQVHAPGGKLPGLEGGGPRLDSAPVVLPPLPRNPGKIIDIKLPAGPPSGGPGNEEPQPLKDDAGDPRNKAPSHRPIPGSNRRPGEAVQSQPFQHLPNWIFFLLHR